MWVVLGASPAFAQQSAGRITAEQRDIGRVEVRIQKYEQALGVITELARPLGTEVECQGVCYYPSSTRPVTWNCAPNRACSLHCGVNPPAGGCD